MMTNCSFLSTQSWREGKESVSKSKLILLVIFSSSASAVVDSQDLAQLSNVSVISRQVIIFISKTAILYIKFAGYV